MSVNHKSDDPGRKPPWLRVRIKAGEGHSRISNIVRKHGLHTVCEGALCPNIGTCWDCGRATIMILGGVCTRGCSFCGVSAGWTGTCDRSEPKRTADAVREMGLKDVVLTSVTRDDLPDGGASIWAETIRRVHEAVPGSIVEALIPDFGGDAASLDTVFDAKPEILGHNMETMKSLYPLARQAANYVRSLRILERASMRGLVTKTALMLGLGESNDEVVETMRDVRKTGCEILFLGQYLQPTKKHAPVKRYVTPEEFERLGEEARSMGIPLVVAAPLVRSSYHSPEQDRYVGERLRKRSV